LVAVEVAGAVSVVVVVVVVVVVAVPVVAAVPVSSTTAGASAAGTASGAAASFFWQPVASAMAVAAANPKVRNFFISLISFFLKKALFVRSALESPMSKIDAEVYRKHAACQAERHARRSPVSRLSLAPASLSPERAR
jgi:hypothetical protein